MPPTVPRPRRTRAGTAVAGAVLTSAVLLGPAAAQSVPEQVTSAGAGDASTFAPADAIAPSPGPYGTFADAYLRNTPEHMTPSTNPAIGVLERMLDHWTPGASWDDGTVLDTDLHEENIERVVEITTARTPAEAERAWVVDRRHQSYSMIEGLGADGPAFARLTNAGTTIAEVPADAVDTSYSDGGNSNGRWADQDSPLGSVVRLVDTVRGPHATSNRAKEYYQYMRPFRWSEDVQVVPELVVQIKPEDEAVNDGGFPSGHTNAAFLAGLGLATAVPEHYGDIMLTAAELGYNRVVAGMHSPLDVIGGRVLATGIAGATLADPANAELIAAARADTERLLEPVAELDTDRAAYRADLAHYRALTTFGLTPVSEPGNEPRVPEGAEALLRSRFPYLDDEQLRWVLHSTALESGLPIVDDAEGWGRTNLFAAAHGYGAFDRDVSVDMDADDGGAAAADVWINDITGPGGLSKSGTGSLVLAGQNTFAGGVLVTEGEVVATQPAALGSGDVELTGGRLVDEAAEPLRVDGDFAQSDTASLQLTADGASEPALAVSGDVTLGGTLDLDLSRLAELPEELPVVAHDGVATGTFDDLVITGAPTDSDLGLRYDEAGVFLVVTQDTAEPAPSPSSPAAPDAPADPATPTSPAAPGTEHPDAGGAQGNQRGALATTGADGVRALLLAAGLVGAAGGLLLVARHRRTVP